MATPPIKNTKSSVRSSLLTFILKEAKNALGADLRERLRGLRRGVCKTSGREIYSGGPGTKPDGISRHHPLAGTALPATNVLACFTNVVTGGLILVASGFFLLVDGIEQATDRINLLSDRISLATDRLNLATYPHEQQ
jgi:hypothetical protein